MDNKQVKFGITQAFACNYLPKQQEQLLVLLDNQLVNPATYNEVIAMGFRRSGENIYRPHCPNCNACNSIRIPVASFKPSKSQKRVWNKNRHLIIKIQDRIQPNHYSLYERYINTIHQDGSMFPASEDQLRGFLPASWMDSRFIECWDQDKLVAVCVTDQLKNSLSALYTFYAPEESSLSLGTFGVLQQIELCRAWGKNYLYLGYQIDQCNKMNYKTRFSPYERLINGEWKQFSH